MEGISNHQESEFKTKVELQALTSKGTQRFEALTNPEAHFSAEAMKAVSAYEDVFAELDKLALQSADEGEDQTRTQMRFICEQALISLRTTLNSEGVSEDVKRVLHDISFPLREIDEAVGGKGFKFE